MKNKKILAICAICLAVGITAVSLMGMSSGDPGAGAEEAAVARTIVETTTPHRGSITVTGSFVGSVEAGQQVTVYPKVPGEVLSVNYGVGDVVEAGAVLFQIDSTSLQLQVAETQAKLANAEALAQHNLDVAQRGLEDLVTDIDDGLNADLLKAETTVTSAQTNVEAKEIALQVANNSYRLARDAYNDYISGRRTDLEYSTTTEDTLRNQKVNAELALEGAQLDLENAKTSLEDAKTGLAAAQRAIEEGIVKSQDGIRTIEINGDMTASYLGLQQLQTTLADYTVTSPISGVIEACNVEQFDMVSAGVPSYVIANKEAMTITFNVAETALGYMSPGNTVTIEKDGQTAPGVITEVSTMVTAGGLYTVKASVSNVPFNLYSGSTVKIYADTQRVENELLIPIDAVYYENGNPYVYVFQNNTAIKTYIETGLSDAEFIQVKSGLTDSAELIVTWSSNLYDGAEVYLPGTAPAVTAEEEDGETDSDPDATGETAGDDAQDGASDASEEAGDGSAEDGEDRGDVAPDSEAEEEAE